jgi:hypothetical protein
MLLPDFGQTRLWSAEIPVWEDTVSIYGKLQVASTSHVRELLAAGCLDRNLVILARQIDPLLNDPEVRCVRLLRVMSDKTRSEHNESGVGPESRHPTGHGFAPLRAKTDIAPLSHVS